jgi:ureidoacrylate peracid hydrolase
MKEEQIMRDTALLVLDMQNDLVHRDGRLRKYFGDLHPKVELVIENIRRLLTAARQHVVPIFYSIIVYRPDYSDAHSRSPSRRHGTLKRGSWGAEIVAELKPSDSDFIIEKRRPSAFFNTELNTLLRSLGIKRLVLTGTHTQIVVESTARDAFNHDYDVIVVGDATASSSRELHEGALAAIRSYFGQVMATKTVLELMAS